MTPPATDDTPDPGLTTAEARERLEQFGPNQPAADHKRRPWAEAFALFTNPLALILLASAGVSAWVGDETAAGIITFIVLVGAAINFVQSYRSSAAIHRLREVVGVTATVRRDGAWVDVPRRKVVPGDTIRLCAGDLVPADCRLLTARDLHVQQAALTGESLPVEKEAATPRREDRLKPSDRDAVFFGTSVVSGIATAHVRATGPETAFGAIAARLLARPPETEFDRGTRRFGLFITQAVLVLVFFVFLTNAALQRDPLQSLLFAVALAVGLTPEFLPMITAVTLSTGAVRMARQKVVVKHLAALQNLGSIDVLCCDKTGTLTKGELELVRVLDPLGAPAERPFVLARLNSVFETGIKSPLDVAILRYKPFDASAYRKVDEIPFDFERRRLSVAVDGPGGRSLITKGAPEGVLRCCTRYETSEWAVPLDDAARGRVTALCAGLSGQSYRLLAVAVKVVPGQAVFRVGDEADLTLVGLLAFLDPPREDAADVLVRLRAAGVIVKVLTGDNELVTRHICEQVGLIVGRVILGDDLDGMSESALGHVAEEATVFARLAPHSKAPRAARAQGPRARRRVPRGRRQ